jgi:hypothetical protein
MLRKRRIGLIAVGPMLAAALVTGLTAGPAGAAAAHSTIHPARAMNLTADYSGSCGIWSDGITFGIKCTGISGWTYLSQARCKNGRDGTGPLQIGTGGVWSYAYCSKYDTTINYAWPHFYREFANGPSAGTAARPVTSAADPSGSCTIWTDGTTFGIKCTGFSGWTYFAAAVCNNGVETPGTRESGTSGTWSYAYCSKYHTTINYGDPHFVP